MPNSGRRRRPGVLKDPQAVERREQPVRDLRRRTSTTGNRPWSWSLKASGLPTLEIFQELRARCRVPYALTTPIRWHSFGLDRVENVLKVGLHVFLHPQIETADHMRDSTR